eukprot:m.173712 g.173712  ORF g.173712 m.173712 type:complete len:438 (-) comp15311_c0_seq1:75-1388(-)
MEASTFPILKIPETVQCLQELSIPITEADLKDPQPALIKNVYETFVQILMEIKAEDFRQPNFALLSSFEFHELHEESLSHLIFLSALTRLMSTCGVHNFALRDIIRPEPKRTNRALSALINFAKFREDQVAKYQRLVTETDQLNEAKQRAEYDNADLQQRLAALKAERAREQPAVDALQSEVQALMAEIQDHHNTQLGLKATIHKLKEEFTGIIDAISSTALAVQTVQQDNVRLKGRIVQSPERMRREMAEVAAGLERERETASTAERSFQTHAAATQGFEAAKLDVTKAIRLAEELVRDVARTKQAEGTLEEVRDEAEKAQRHLQETNHREQHAAQLLSSAKQRQTRLVQKHELKRVTATQAMDERQRDLAAVRSDHDAVRARGPQLDAARSEHAQRRAGRARTHEADVGATRAELRRLMAQVAAYQAELVAAVRE